MARRYCTTACWRPCWRMPMKGAAKRTPKPGTGQSPPPPTGGEMAADPRPIRLPNGQLIGQPGSNGGVHRGPDLVSLRRNVVRAIIFHQLSKAGLSVADVKAK